MHVPYVAFAMHFAHAADDFLNHCLGHQLVPWKNRRTETNVVHTGEHRNESSVFFRILQCHAADLGHGFTNQRAWHDRMSREMALEKWFIHGDAFHTNGIVHRYQFGDLVYQQHGVSVRQNFHNFFNVKFHDILLYSTYQYFD